MGLRSRFFLFPSSSSSPSESDSFLLADVDEDDETAKEPEEESIIFCILDSFSMMSSAVESESREYDFASAAWNEYRIL